MHKYKVQENKLITPTVRLLTLVCEDESKEPLLYQPGQYAAISLRDQKRPTVVRCFSIASSPTQQRVLQFSVRVKGKYTSALQRLQPGDDVYVRGPFGAFVFNQYQHKDLVLLAGGIGIAPFMSMMKYANDVKVKNRIHLVYSCRSQDDIPFREDLARLQKENPNLRVTYVIASGGAEKLQDEEVVKGRMDASNIGRLGLRYNNQVYMVCGPQPYMNAMRGLLLKNGVPKDRIMSEAFSQGSQKHTGKLISWPVNMYILSGVSLAVLAFFVTLSDLNKNLPDFSISSLAAEHEAQEANNSAAVPIEDISTLPPQVASSTSAASPATAATPTPITTVTSPVVTQPITVVPITRPRSRIS